MYVAMTSDDDNKADGLFQQPKRSIPSETVSIKGILDFISAWKYRKEEKSQ